jgi:hypothetical protein
MLAGEFKPGDVIGVVLNAQRQLDLVVRHSTEEMGRFEIGMALAVPAIG